MYTNFGEVVGVVVVIGGPIQEFGTSAFAVHFKAILGSIGDIVVEGLRGLGGRFCVERGGVGNRLGSQPNGW